MSAATWINEGWRPSGESRPYDRPHPRHPHQTQEGWCPSGEPRSWLLRQSWWPGEPRQEDSAGLTVKFFTLSTASIIPGPMEPAVLTDHVKFHYLVKQWNEQRVETSSSISEIIACPAYLRIIAMGRRALPLIIEQLKKEGDDPDHWCAALEAITGENPVPEDAHGDTVRIAQAWIEWSETSWIFRALDEGRTTESRVLGPLSITALPGLLGPIHVGGGQAQAVLPAVIGPQE